MKHLVLLYDFGPDFEARRAEHRGSHLAHALRSVARGELVHAGALLGPMDAGLFLFRAPSAAVAEEFARGDPYVTAGLVPAWRVREWATAVGNGATTPATRPEPDGAAS